MVQVREINKELNGIIWAYDKLVGGIENKALSDTSRAYGGIIRAGKGKMVEEIGQNLIELAWARLGGSPLRVEVTPGKRVKIPLKRDYIKTIKEDEIRKYISQNIDKYFYKVKTDIHVKVDGKLVLSVECKSYTENAMIKRVLVDCSFLKTKFPSLKFALLQLESHLGGDYSELGEVAFGSYSTHTILSYFDVVINIITLLKGERRVDKPIHKPEFFKPLERGALEKAVKAFSDILEVFV